MDKLPEAAGEEARKWAVVFDFDGDSCYPSPAVSADGIQNPGLDAQDWSSMTDGCREEEQLENSNTYYRKASIEKNGVEFAVHMYALYFLKDKTVWGAGDAGHRHDWEFALVWTTGNQLTHASFSHHGKVTTRKTQELHFDAAAPNSVKVVYHKDNLSTGGITHAMRFADEGDDVAENHSGHWITPPIVDWHRMKGNGLSTQALQDKLNTFKYGEADCPVNDNNFGNEISKEPPPDYPSKAEWKDNAVLPPKKLGPKLDEVPFDASGQKANVPFDPDKQKAKVPFVPRRDKRAPPGA